MNGTSGYTVTEEVLAPTGRTLDDVWISDVVNTFNVKRGSRRRRERGDAQEAPGGGGR